MVHTGLYKFGVNRAAQTLAISAGESGLLEIGRNFNVTRTPAVAAAITATVTATAGTSIPTGTVFTGTGNGVRYATTSVSVTPASGVAALQLTAQSTGAEGNLSAGAELAIESQIESVAPTATVTATTTAGTAIEPVEDYRRRILFAERSIPGGGNATDYRIYAEEVAGVRRAYPFAGLPEGEQDTPSIPGDRVVYVESTTDIHPDGIPTADLQTSVRSNILVDPDTGFRRLPLGLEDSTLYVRPIIRSAYNVTVTNLSVRSEIEGQVRQAISSGLEAYFLGLEPYVDGVDAAFDRNDAITDVSVSGQVQDVLSNFGASASEVAVETEGGTPIAFQRLAPNEKAKLGTVTYVT